MLGTCCWRWAHLQKRGVASAMGGFNTLHQIRKCEGCASAGLTDGQRATAARPAQLPSW